VCEICNFNDDDHSRDHHHFMPFSTTHPVLFRNNDSNNDTSILEESYVDVGKRNESYTIRREIWIRKYRTRSQMWFDMKNNNKKPLLRLCDNCANAMEKRLRRDIEDAVSILKSYEKYELKSPSPHPQIDIDKKIKNRDPPIMIKQMLPRRMYYQKSVLRLLRQRAEEASRDADEFRYRQEDERDRLLRKLQNLNLETKRFKSFNALSDVCSIWYDKKWNFGTISSLRLGTTSRYERVVSASEISAAFGQVVILLLTLAKRLDIHMFSNCQIVELGSKSYVITRRRVVESAAALDDESSSYTLVRSAADHTRLSRQKSNLYLCHHNKKNSEFENIRDVTSLNRAIRCVCDCLEEIALRARDVRKLFCGPLPHIIENGTIGGIPVVFPIRCASCSTGSEEKNNRDGDDGDFEKKEEEGMMRHWSKAMRYLLIDLKFLQAKIIA